MLNFKPILMLCAALALSACAKEIYDSDADVQKASYVHDGAPTLTLLTMISNKNGQGGHSSLLINASQRVMYDPAGRWYSSVVPERNDVLFGMTPAVLKRYNSFHARDTHHVVIQEIPVTAQVAEIAYRTALQQGASHDAMCANNTSRMLSQIPGFEQLGVMWSPAKLSRKFGELPGVKTTKYYETDVGQN
jgi:hypothetical protein